VPQPDAVPAFQADNPNEFAHFYVRLVEHAGEWLPDGAAYIPGIAPDVLCALPLHRIMLSAAPNESLRAHLARRADEDVPAIGTAERKVFQGLGADRFRTAIGRGCTAAGVPTFSPHDLRHRRISLLHRSGVPWPRIGEHAGQRNLAVTANTYSHVLADERELDYVAVIRP
jgi:integrase